MSDCYICPRCKGRRVIFDPMSLLLTVGLPLALLDEMDDDVEDNSITKRICPTCKGKGFLKYE
jgi:hypothetical protein